MVKHAAPPAPPDEAPDQLPDNPDREPEPGDEDDPNELKWHDGFRSMLDHPKHPLHHLKDV